MGFMACVGLAYYAGLVCDVWPFLQLLLRTRQPRRPRPYHLGGGGETTTPPLVSPAPPPPPGPRPGWADPRKPEGQCFFTGAENRIRAGTGAPFARRNKQHHILYGNEYVTMTLLLPSGSNHTISLSNTLPHTGWAGPTKTTTGPTPQGGTGQGT